MELKDLMMLYGVTLGSRRTRKQRYLFAKQVKEQALNNGYEFSMLGHRTPRYHVENIVVGNLEQAKYILAVPYDTPSRSIIPARYYPFHTDLTIKNENLDLLVHFLISLVLWLIAYLCIRYTTQNLLRYIIEAILVAAGIYNLFSHPNKVNFNRYSASVAAGMKILEELTAGKTALVFCDRITTGYDGYRLLFEHLKDHQKVVALDCIAYGSKLTCAHTFKNAAMAKSLADSLNAIDKQYTEEQAEGNVLAVLPNAVFITSGSVEKGEFVIRNTRSSKDIQIDMNRLQCIITAICEYIKHN